MKQNFLSEVFTTIGETTYKSETPICFFIDEIQYMKSKELGSLKEIKSTHVEENIDEYKQWYKENK